MIRFFLMLFCISFTNYINAEGVKMAGEFSVYPSSSDRISRVLNGDGRENYQPSGPMILPPVDGPPIARHDMDQVIAGIESQKKEDIGKITNTFRGISCDGWHV